MVIFTFFDTNIAFCHQILRRWIKLQSQVFNGLHSCPITSGACWVGRQVEEVCCPTSPEWVGLIPDAFESYTNVSSTNAIQLAPITVDNGCSIPHCTHNALYQLAACACVTALVNPNVHFLISERAWAHVYIQGPYAILEQVPTFRLCVVSPNNGIQLNNAEYCGRQLLCSGWLCTCMLQSANWLILFKIIICMKDLIV
jgi:hypothetical protein